MGAVLNLGAKPAPSKRMYEELDSVRDKLHRRFAAAGIGETKMRVGISRTTAHRLRALADADSRSSREGEAAAREFARWLRARGVRSATVSATAHRRVARVQLLLDVEDVARIVGAPRPRKRAPRV